MTNIPLPGMLFLLWRVVVKQSQTAMWLCSHTKLMEVQLLHK